ncbi:phosphatase PAP2 family protein, partial [Streptomyces tendae]
AKYGMGRLGPHYATTIGANEMWLGGDIFPSGHTANAVVTWGILAYLASTHQARRWLSALSAVTSLGVGMSTVYLGTHWLSDVLLGWAAGLLILLALPWFEPLITRAEAAILGLRDRWFARLGRRRRTRRPVGRPVPVAPAASGRPEAPAREPVSTPRTARAPVYLAPGPHTARSDRTPVTPAGSRRPPHADRHPRNTASAARPLSGG